MWKQRKYLWLVSLIFSTVILFNQAFPQTIVADLNPASGNQWLDSLYVTPGDSFRVAVYGDNLPYIFSVGFTFQFDPARIAYSRFDFNKQDERSILFENLWTIPEAKVDQPERFVESLFVQKADSGKVTIYLAVKDTVDHRPLFFKDTGLLGFVTFRAQPVPKTVLTALQLRDRKLAYATQGLVETLPGEQLLRVITIPKYLGDFNANGCIDFWDFVLFAQRFNPRADIGWDPRFDLDNNGFLNIRDFFIFVGNFGKCNH